MKVWLPYIKTGSGTDTFTKTLASGLERQGVEVVVSQYPHFLQYFPWPLKFIRSPQNVDIILTNTWNGFAFKRKGAKLIAVQHLFVLDPLLKPYKSFAQSIFHNTLVKLFENKSQISADLIVSVSQSTAKAYHHCINGDFPEVILNGIDTVFFTPMFPAENRDDIFRLLFVGNFSQRKGADLLPQIMEKLGNKYKLFYTSGLRVKGSPAMHTNMIPLGKMNHEEVREQYRKADLILFPTRLEGLPLSVMEAMACGTPVISHNTSSLPEVIRNNYNGKLCQLDDINCFVHSIKALDKDREHLELMGENAHLDANKYFSVDRMVDNYIGLFKQMNLDTKCQVK